MNAWASRPARRHGASIAQAIRDLYDRDVESLGRAARERVLSRYTWDKALQMQLASYASLIGVRSRQPAPSTDTESEPFEITT